MTLTNSDHNWLFFAAVTKLMVRCGRWQILSSSRVDALREDQIQKYREAATRYAANPAAGKAEPLKESRASANSRLRWFIGIGSV